MVLYVYPTTTLHMIEATESQQVPNQITELLQQYVDVFAIPTTLPPTRPFDHRNPLKGGTFPINSRPYRHPPTQKDAIEITELLQQYVDVFAIPTTLPHTRPFDHRNPLKGGTFPINSRPYRHPPTQKDAIEVMVKELLDTGVIRDNQSPFYSPVVMLKKKDGTWRMCIDFRRLNNATIKDKFHIPVIKELIDELQGSQYFTKLDLRGHPVVYYSKTLAPRYYTLSTYKKELLAVIQALSKWRRYLLDRPFKIKTYHFSLKYLLEQRITTPSQMKWLPKLMRFDYEILYKQGSENKAADAISRIPTSAQLLTMALSTISSDFILVVVIQGSKDHRVVLLEEVETTSKEISMDFIEGLPSSNGKSAIFVVVDRLSKYAHFIPLSHPFTAAQIAQIFLDNVYKLHGLPQVIFSDRDKFSGQMGHWMMLLGSYTMICSNAFHLFSLMLEDKHGLKVKALIGINTERTYTCVAPRNCPLVLRYTVKLSSKVALYRVVNPSRKSTYRVASSPCKWDHNLTPWVQEIATSFKRLKVVRFQSLVVRDLDLELLARSSGEKLRVLEIDSCSGFSTDGLLYVDLIPLIVRCICNKRKEFVDAWYLLTILSCLIHIKSTVHFYTLHIYRSDNYDFLTLHLALLPTAPNSGKIASTARTQTHTRGQITRH
nr:reverse transcriptase [Tanacetum cinerariifolium]